MGSGLGRTVFTAMPICSPEPGAEGGEEGKKGIGPGTGDGRG